MGLDGFLHPRLKGVQGQLFFQMHHQLPFLKVGLEEQFKGHADAGKTSQDYDSIDDGPVAQAENPREDSSYGDKVETGAKVR